MPGLSSLLFRLLLGRRLPVTSGTLHVHGLERAVTIRRDGHGIPHIEAETSDDAWYGLGFCHGQDRAFQLESLLRAVCGTMAELVGPSGLAVDRFSRRIGFHRAAEQQLATLHDDVRAMLEAYARGVTDGARIGCPRPAHEFSLLRSALTPYDAVDALGMVKLMSLDLSANWDAELARLQILTEDGPEALRALDPAYPEWLPVTAPPQALAGRAAQHLAKDLAAFVASAGGGRLYSAGSNSWAIAVSRTATGRPILASDPHISPGLPSPWYLAHVSTPDWAAAGATLVGIPGFPIGHNGFAAWGNTAGYVDTTDLFVEEIGPDGQSARDGDRFVPCVRWMEAIRVRGGAPVEEEVMITPRGPIIGPAFGGERRAISMRATWLAPRPLGGLLQAHRARSFEEFRHLFEDWPVAALNMVYADMSGTVGWQLAGQAPRRRKGWGALPLAGWDPEAGWEEALVPFEDMPHLADPKAGFVASANNRPTPEGQGPFLGVDWIDGYRLARIVEVLESRTDWDLDSVGALQLDQTSLPWREMRDRVLSTPSDTDEARQALELLAAWDGVVAADSPAAAVYSLFSVEMLKRIAQAKAPRATLWALEQGGLVPLHPRSAFALWRVGHLVRLVRAEPEGWFEHCWAHEMADALAAAVRTLRRRCGRASEQWAWGQVRPLTLRHMLGEQRPLDRVFNRGPFPCGGDVNTVNQACPDPMDPLANPMVTSSLRMVADVGNWDGIRFSLPGGQSGNPLSPHYDDLLALWQRGQAVPIAWSPTQVEQAARSVLRLVPG